MDVIWDEVVGDGPLVATAIHDGHEVREEVVSLLQAHDEMGDFLQTPAAEQAAADARRPVPARLLCRRRWRSQRVARTASRNERLRRAQRRSRCSRSLCEPWPAECATRTVDGKGLGIG